MKLTHHYQVISAGTDLTDTRAWMISPEGDSYPCGWDHSFCETVYPEIFGTDQDLQLLVRDGWGKVGWFTTVVYMEVFKLTDTLLRALQEITFNLKFKDNYYVQIISGTTPSQFKYKNFKKFETASELWMFEKQSRKRASFDPDSWKIPLKWELNDSRPRQYVSKLIPFERAEMLWSAMGKSVNRDLHYIFQEVEFFDYQHRISDVDGLWRIHAVSHPDLFRVYFRPTNPQDKPPDVIDLHKNLRAPEQDWAPDSYIPDYDNL